MQNNVGSVFFYFRVFGVKKLFTVKKFNIEIDGHVPMSLMYPPPCQARTSGRHKDVSNLMLYYFQQWNVVVHVALCPNNPIKGTERHGKLVQTRLINDCFVFSIKTGHLTIKGEGELPTLTRDYHVVQASRDVSMYCANSCTARIHVLCEFMYFVN